MDNVVLKKIYLKPKIQWIVIKRSAIAEEKMGEMEAYTKCSNQRIDKRKKLLRHILNTAQMHAWYIWFGIPDEENRKNGVEQYLK